MRSEHVELFCDKFSDKPLNIRHIGVEEEIAICRDSQDYGRADAVPAIEQIGQSQGYALLSDDIKTRQIVGFRDEEGRVLTTEFSRHVIEIAYPPRPDLGSIDTKDIPWRNTHEELFARRNLLFLKYGTVPNLPISRLQRAPKGRYIPLEKALTKRVRVTGLTASTQVSIEVSMAEMIRAVNVCNALSGISIALTANSSIWQGKDSGVLAVRESVWDSFAPERVGVPKRKFSDIEDYLEHLCGFRALILKDEDGYFIPSPDTTFADIDAGLDGDFLNAWKYHEGTVWYNARLRAPFGTIEIRPGCTQPRGEMLSIAALWLGIIENLDEAEGLVNMLPWDTWRSLRTACIKEAMKAVVGGVPANWLAKSMLEIAERGLNTRNQGEESYLGPLWNRLDRERTPAEDTRDIFHRKGVSGVIEAVS